MLTILRYALVRSRGQILGWGICLAVLGGYLVSFFDTLAEQQAALDQLFQSYPRELLAFFGDLTQFSTPAGFLQVEFFSYMPLVLGIYAVLAGSGLLAGDEESGNLDLVLSYPLLRRDLFLGRLAGFLLAISGILALTWIGFVIVLHLSGMAVWTFWYARKEHSTDWSRWQGVVRFVRSPSFSSNGG